VKHSALLIGALFAFAIAARTFAAVPMSPAGDGHATVPVRVNGHGPYPFILDSGAEGSAVYQWFVDKAALPREKGKGGTLSGQTGSTKVTTYHVRDFELDGHHLRGVSAYGMANRHDAGREAGVLGNDFMNGKIVVYDFPCHRISVHARSANLRKIVGGEAMPVQAGLANGTNLLTLPVTVNGYTGTAILDTGSRKTRLTPAFAKAAGIDVSSPQFRAGKAIFGANAKKMVPRTGPVGTVRFGGVAVGHARAQIMDLPVLAEIFKGKPAMLLGADLMGRFRLVYDHAGRKVWFTRSQCKAPG
jgi:predicted aspartyl protease